MSKTTVTPAEEIRTSDAKKRKKKKRSGSGARFIRRTLLLLFTIVILLAVGLCMILNTIFNGPSESARNVLTMSLSEASATKWVPGLFLPEKTVNEIITKSEEVVEDKVSLEDYNSDKNTEITEKTIVNPNPLKKSGL
jgi:flagellar basal body-associated protein FliL